MVKKDSGKEYIAGYIKHLRVNKNYRDRYIFFFL